MHVVTQGRIGVTGKGTTLANFLEQFQFRVRHFFPYLEKFWSEGTALLTVYKTFNPEGTAPFF